MLIKLKRMIKPTEMTTLSQVIEKLRLKRQDNEFILTPGGFTIGHGRFYQPHDLKIIKTYRFEGESDPSDESILYVMEGNDGTLGYSVDAYGAFSNHDDVHYTDFILRIPLEERDDQLLYPD
jgi:hypothetical protein